MILLPKYDNAKGDEPHSFESYQAQKPCRVAIVRQANSKECREAFERGEHIEPVYVPTRPIIVCNCGRMIGLKNHSVAEDGTVSASFYHKKGDGKHEDPHGCEWHENIKLDGYNGKAYPRLADDDHNSD